MLLNGSKCIRNQVIHFAADLNDELLVNIPTDEMLSNIINNHITRLQQQKQRETKRNTRTILFSDYLHRYFALGAIGFFRGIDTARHDIALSVDSEKKTNPFKLRLTES